MNKMMTVWAFQPLAELDNKTGFVTCDPELAKKLIADGDAQDPRIGAMKFKQITTKPKKTTKGTRQRELLKGGSDEPTN